MTVSFLTTVVICLFIAILGCFFHYRWSPRSIVQGPALLTMLGIAGTFFGIAVGLFAFNSNDIQHSIPGLIDGMRTSVWASFIGILFAISLKLRYALSRDDHSEDANKSETELLAASIEEGLEQLQQSIVGNDEGTLLSQMKLARSDMNDGFRAIEKSNNEFMERLAEMSSKQLVEALRDVIRDFNKNLTEQFGENFKELNAAVFKLVEWQQQYKEHLSELIGIERESATHLRTAVDQHKAALSSSENLLTVAKGFESILEAADAYKGSLKQNTEMLASVLQEVRRDVPALREELSGLVSSISEAVARHETDVRRLAEEISARFSQAADAVQNELTDAMATANKEITDTVAKLVGSTKEQAEALQTSLEESLNESLRTLGQQLASLSSKFADDYGPITERLREIVMIGR